MSQGPARERFIILYDGLCGLCNRLNRFVLKRDTEGRFRFASLQSEFSREVLIRHRRPATDVNTLYVLREVSDGREELFSKSEAVVTILDQLSGFRPWVVLMKILPTAITDLGYDLVAKNRYRFFGRYDVCPLPSSEERERFIQI